MANVQKIARRHPRPHHITQPGNNRRAVFFSSAGRETYLKLLQQYCSEFGVRVLGCCLMTNHAHIIAAPQREISLANAFGRAHNDHSRWLNVSRRESGHVWQSRFHSCPLERPHCGPRCVLAIVPARVRNAAAPTEARTESQIGGGRSGRVGVARGEFAIVVSALGTWIEFIHCGDCHGNLNRLTSMTDNGSGSALKRAFQYDAYGNMWVTQNDTGLPLNPATPAVLSVGAPNPYNGSNRLTAAAGGQYDQVGNQTTVGTYTLAYDAENRQVTATNSLGGAVTNYVYDGDGRRVSKVSNGIQTIFVYDAAGQLAAEYSNGPAETGCQTCYISADHLGSTRMVTNENAQVVERHDYMPFGEEIINGFSGRGALWGMNSGVSNQKFTGKERDSESGLDYFGARYYGSGLGRFSSPDAPTVDQHPADPQSWNLYAYVRNNPLALIDPTGLDCVYAGFNGDGKPVGSIDHNSNVGSCGDSHGTWVPGTVNADALAYNTVTNLFQAASNDGQNVYFETFTAGAQTDASGNANPNLSGGFAIAKSAATDSLASQIVGQGTLGGLLSFMANRTETLHLLGSQVLAQLSSGPLNFTNDNWAGPGGAGPPLGQGDWNGAVHDYNFLAWNGGVDRITLGSYFTFRNSPEKARALMQADHNLIRNTGGVQGAKFGLFFGAVNAFQWYANSWK